jgi:hypothetical protein
MKYTKIYIGSNNITGILEVDKIKEVLATGQCGYTLTQGIGYWEGKNEDTAIVEIYGDYNLGIIPELKRVCMQDSIMVASSIVDVNF